MTELLPCPFCGSPAETLSEGAITCANSSCPVVCVAPSQGYRSDYDPVASWNTRTPAPAQASWMLPETAPGVKPGNEKEFVVAVYRAHSGKVYTFACSYLNASRIQYEECPKDNREGFCAGCDDGCPTTGWFRLTGDDSNESGCYQSLDLRDGDKMLGWQPLPAWASPVTSTHQPAPVEPQAVKETDEVLRLRAAIDYACDLLAERTYGSSARLPGHNARLHLETALAVTRPSTLPSSSLPERIEKLLHELRYEVERGMLERDIDETMGFRFYVPLSNSIPDGVVFCEFRTRPVPRHYMIGEDLQPRLRLVKGGAGDVGTQREGS